MALKTKDEMLTSEYHEDSVNSNVMTVSQPIIESVKH
jgi:hypothetical protein